VEEVGVVVAAAGIDEDHPLSTKVVVGHHYHPAPPTFRPVAAPAAVLACQGHSEIEKDPVDVGLRPLRAVEAGEHAPGRILLGPVGHIATLAGQQFLVAGFRHWGGFRHQLKVEIEIGHEGRKHGRVNQLVSLFPEGKTGPQESRGEVGLRFGRNRPTLGEPLLPFLPDWQQPLPHFRGMSLVGLEGGLQIQGDQVS